MKLFHDRAVLPLPRVAISACLAGDAVRYDGDHKAQPLLLQTLRQQVRWIRLCPEVAAGLGVPRPAVQLRQGGHGIAVVEVAEPARNHTTALQQAVTDSIRQLMTSPPAAIVLKARSPSCGIGSTSLFDDQGASMGVTDGIFAKACRTHFPTIPLVDEAALTSVHACQAFALLLIIRTDIEQVDPARRPALDAHYRNGGIDTTAPWLLPQQLAAWPQQRITQSFAALWPNID